MSENFWKEDISIGYYDTILEKGIKKQRGFQSNWHNSTFLKVKTFVGDDSNHLDYACGPGTFVGKYTNANSICVDLIDQQVEFGKKKYGDKGNFIFYKDFDKEKYKNYFDVITVLGLLEFLDDDSNIHLINDLYNMLKPGGKLIMTTPNYRSSMVFFELVLNLFGKINYSNTHINKFNKSSLETLAKTTNFSEIKVIKFLNFGSFFSFFNWRFGIFIDKFIHNMFSGFFGYLLLLELKK